GQPFKNYLSPAWQPVELEDRYAAMKAWRALIKKTDTEQPEAHKTEQESQPTKKRAEYEGDLELFMTNPKSAARFAALSLEGVGGVYLKHHEQRRRAGENVPALPGKSNRKRDITNMVKKIRERLESQQQPAGAI